MLSKDDPRMKNTIIIGTWCSECGNCGKNALTQDKFHDCTYGYKPEVGCGTEFKYATSFYMGSDESWCPDGLEWIGESFKSKVAPEVDTLS